MRILDQYICRTVIRSTSLVMLVFLMLELFVYLTNELGNIGKAHYTLVVMALYILFKLPAMLYMMFPIIAFLGCLVGLSQLAKGSELTIMRVSGLSILKITQLTIIAAIIMVSTVTVLGELGAARLEQYAAHLKASALGKSQTEANIWLHQPGKFLNLGDVKSNHLINDVTEFMFQDHQLSKVVFARDAVRDGGRWQLNDIHVLSLEGGRVSKTHAQTYPLTFNFSPGELLPYHNDSLDGSIWHLYGVIEHRKQAGMISTLFEYEFWRRVFQPITTLLMICLGVPFVFGSLRGRGATARLMLGTIIGIVYYFIARIFGPISLVFQLPPLLAAIVPTLVVAIIYLFFVRRLM